MMGYASGSITPPQALSDYADGNKRIQEKRWAADNKKRLRRAVQERNEAKLREEEEIAKVRLKKKTARREWSVSVIVKTLSKNSEGSESTQLTKRPIAGSDVRKSMAEFLKVEENCNNPEKEIQHHNNRYSSTASDDSFVEIDSGDESDNEIESPLPVMKVPLREISSNINNFTNNTTSVKDKRRVRILPKAPTELFSCTEHDEAQEQRLRTSIARLDSLIENKKLMLGIPLLPSEHIPKSYQLVKEESNQIEQKQERERQRRKLLYRQQ